MLELIALTYISALVQIVPMILSAALGWWIIRKLKSETIGEIAHSSSFLASTQTSITHAEIPFPLLAVMARLYGLSIYDFQKLWMKEEEKRCRKVLEVYGKDRLTTEFTKKFGSKYLLHGYVGSEALLCSGNLQTPTTRSQRIRCPHHTYEIPESCREEKSKSQATASDSIKDHKQCSSGRPISGKEKHVRITPGKEKPQSSTAHSDRINRSDKKAAIDKEEAELSIHKAPQ